LAEGGSIFFLWVLVLNINVEMGRIVTLAGDPPLGGNSLFVEMMGFEPMSKFVFQKIFYKFSRIVLTNLSSVKPAKP